MRGSSKAFAESLRTLLLVPVVLGVATCGGRSQSINATRGDGEAIPTSEADENSPGEANQGGAEPVSGRSTPGTTTVTGGASEGSDTTTPADTSNPVNATQPLDASVPVQPPASPEVVTLSPTVGCAQQLASGDAHTCVLYDDGRVACVGANDFGQLGDGTTEHSPSFVHSAVDDVSLIAAGGNTTCAASRANVSCWGDNGASQLGVADLAQSSEPLLTLSAPDPSAVIQLALGRQHGCALNGLIHGYCWGTAAGEATLPSAVQLPQIGSGPRQVLQLGAARTRIVEDGRLYDVAWEVGGPSNVALTPNTPDGVIANSIGIDHDCLLKKSGTVWCRGGPYPAYYAVVADFGTEVAEVVAGDGVTCARAEDGAVWCRGKNELGQLGDGTLDDTSSATGVRLGRPAVEISLGQKHACARLDNGSVWCWGWVPGAQPSLGPEHFSGPAPGERCANVVSVPVPFNISPTESTGADELDDALLAWAQNQCRCGDVQPEPEPAAEPVAVPECTEAETVVLNGCLQALATDADDTLRCLAEEPWFRSVCAASCQGTGERLPSECLAASPIAASPASCGELPSVLRFCRRRFLGCDGALSEVQVGPYETCDGKNDCPNGFDEANCSPGAMAFTCADGSQVAIAVVGDETPDCPDGSDEWIP